MASRCPGFSPIGGCPPAFLRRTHELLAGLDGWLAHHLELVVVLGDQLQVLLGRALDVLVGSLWHEPLMLRDRHGLLAVCRNAGVELRLNRPTGDAMQRLE